MTNPAWMSTPGGSISVASFLYDGEGHRVEQVASSGGARTTRTYVGNLEELATTGATTTTTAYYGGLGRAESPLSPRERGLGGEVRASSPRAA